MKRAIAIPILAALVAAGCIGQAPSPTEPVETQVVGGSGVVPGAAGNNTTVALKPPVARMQVFDTDGALVYESNFVADNATAGAPVQGGSPVTFLGSLSEAVDKTARVDEWEWTFGDGGKATGRGVNHTFRDTGGVFTVALKVTDTNGLTDVQTVKIGVLATRVLNETVGLAGTVQGPGVLGVPAQEGLDVASVAIEVKDNVQGFPVVVDGLTLTLKPGSALPTDMVADFDLFLLGADGSVIASSANAPVPAPGGEETISIGSNELEAGTYTLQVVLVAGLNASYTIEGAIDYLVVNPDVAGMFGEHAGH